MFIPFAVLLVLIVVENTVLRLTIGTDTVDTVAYSLPLIVLHGIFMIYYLVKRDRQYGGLMSIALLLRLVVLMADYFKWFPILNSGADTEFFHFLASNLNYLPDQYTEYAHYPQFLHLLYAITDSSRLIAQYVNVMFGMGIIWYVRQTLRLLDVPEKPQTIALLVLAFMPNLIIFSGILLREAWVEFFAALSLWYFVRWFKGGQAADMLLSVVCVLAGAFMHAGIIGLLFGYIVGFLSYNPRTGVIQFSTSTIVSLIVIGGGYLLISDSFSLFTGKFQTYQTDNGEMEFVSYANSTNKRGDSTYLQWLNVTNPVVGMLIAPLRMVYFLFAPLPTEWHRVSDVAGFLVDSIFYLCMCVVMMRHKSIQHQKLKKYLVAAILATTFIFGYGTSNAGTAFRHRAKQISIIAVAFALSYAPDRAKSLAEPKPELDYRHVIRKRQ